MQKTTGWLRSRAILTQEMLLDTVQHHSLVSDIILLHIIMSVDTMARTYC